MTSISSPNAIDQLRSTDGAGRAQIRQGFNFAGLWTLYVLTLRQHLHGKRWLIMLALFLLPAGIADIVRLAAPNAESIRLEFIFVWMFIPHAILPLVALVYASGIISDEQEEQTITYLLIRPLPKWAIYLVKLLATLTTTVVLTSVFTALTYAAIYLGANSNVPDVPQRCLTTMALHSLAVGAYCCLFGFISLVTKRVLVAGILYMVVVEGAFAYVKFGVRHLTIIYYVRLIAYRLLDFTLSHPKYVFNVNMADEAWKLDSRNDPELLEHPTMRTCFIVLLGACLAFSLIAAFLCSRREFHVKTPEKN